MAPILSESFCKAFQSDLTQWYKNEESFEFNSNFLTDRTDYNDDEGHYEDHAEKMDLDTAQFTGDINETGMLYFRAHI